MKPEVLFLAHRIPYPPDKGDKIRSWRILKFLTDNYRVHLACFADDPRDLMHRDFLETLCESATIIPLDPRAARIKSVAALAAGQPLSFQYFCDARMVAAVRKLRKKPLSAEIVFSSSMTPYIKKPIDDRIRIVDFCDTDAEKWRDYARDAKGPMKVIYQREAKLLEREETDITSWADACFAVSAEEAAIFNARADVTNTVASFSNGVDAAYFDPIGNVASDTPEYDCVFIGAMDYRANIDGVLHFVKHVWPLVRQSQPEATFAIVGANPAPAVAALHGESGITVTGRVDDIRPWLGSAKVSVAPLRVGRGIQNKVLEAMAMAMPVVASPAAMAGIAAPRDAALTATTNEAMAASILALLDDAPQCERIGRAARHFVLTHHQWDQTLKPLEDKLTALGL